MITLTHFSVHIEGTPILSDISHTFSDGSLTAILGHNGSGKSSLALSLMGHPRYICQGSVLLSGEEIIDCSPSDRHHK